MHTQHMIHHSIGNDISVLTTLNPTLSRNHNLAWSIPWSIVHAVPKPSTTTLKALRNSRQLFIAGCSHECNAAPMLGHQHDQHACGMTDTEGKSSPQQEPSMPLQEAPANGTCCAKQHHQHGRKLQEHPHVAFSASQHMMSQLRLPRQAPHVRTITAILEQVHREELCCTSKSGSYLACAMCGQPWPAEMCEKALLPEWDGSQALLECCPPCYFSIVAWRLTHAHIAQMRLQVHQSTSSLAECTRVRSPC
jgi:hypothetical protein